MLQGGGRKLALRIKKVMAGPDAMCSDIFWARKTLDQQPRAFAQPSTVPMAFRKRNVGINRTPTGSDAPSPAAATAPAPASIPGIRPSPVDGRPTTSTGTPSLDGILAGHAGFALGSSLLIEESGTTDFAGALLKYYAAEGIIQGHKVHVVGLGEPWGRELPGLVGVADGEPDAAASGNKSKERMKIAWRYERLGEFEAEKRIGGARVC
ncbi:Elongator complex protein 4 [Neofusicoccum parvum]|uniref:Elongator complex protein 4 n=1 Tax=Neofusicoccum parvum TaxID=310453 RepID=A0ACB5S393_9PEZI|nr:Elongator complex protein 4 [Neofusicoccum parvum]